MPHIIIHNEYTHRADVLKVLNDKNCLAIELGVAEGHFSRMVLQNSEDSNLYLYSVDMWAGDRGHDIDEYRTAVSNLEPWKERNTILRMSFDEALPLFPNDHFGLIYVDGYAHTGEGEGKYFRDWWPKLKPGGILAGDDYHTDWPLVIREVNRFANEVDLDVHIIPSRIEGDKWSMYPTWWIRKTS